MGMSRSVALLLSGRSVQPAVHVSELKKVSASPNVASFEVTAMETSAIAAGSADSSSSSAALLVRVASEVASRLAMRSPRPGLTPRAGQLSGPQPAGLGPRVGGCWRWTYRAAWQQQVLSERVELALPVRDPRW